VINIIIRIILTVIIVINIGYTNNIKFTEKLMLMFSKHNKQYPIYEIENNTILKFIEESEITVLGNIYVMSTNDNIIFDGNIEITGKPRLTKTYDLTTTIGYQTKGTMDLESKVYGEINNDIKILSSTNIKLRLKSGISINIEKYKDFQETVKYRFPLEYTIKIMTTRYRENIVSIESIGKFFLTAGNINNYIININNSVHINLTEMMSVLLEHEYNTDRNKNNNINNTHNKLTAGVEITL